MAKCDPNNQGEPKPEGDQEMETPRETPTYEEISAEDLAELAKKFGPIVYKPHDHFFRGALSNRLVALEAINEYISPELKDMARIDEYKMVKESFIDPDMVESISDVLMSVPLEGEHRAYLYFLFEHQRKPKKMMALRLRQLEHRIFDYHLAVCKTGKLPLIQKIVVYNGEAEWEDPPDFYQLFEVSPELARRIMERPYALKDLGRMSEEHMENASRWMLTKLAMKNIDNRRFATTIADFIMSVAKISKDYSGRKFFRLVLKYLLVAQKGDDIAEVVENAIQSIKDKEFGEVGMILALQLKQRGIIEGERKGIEKGIEKGFEKGTLQVATRLLKTGQPPAYVQEVTDLDEDTIKELISKLA